MGLGHFKGALLALALVACEASPAVGQPQETDATLDAYAAGYKAAFTCSATFNAGKTAEQIEADEFYGIYPLIADRLARLDKPFINLSEKYVSVKMPGGGWRTSQWRPHLGCTQLPVGAPSGGSDALPVVDLPAPDASTDDGAPWTTRAPVGGPSGNSALDAVIDSAFKEGPYGAAANTSAVLIATPTEIIAERYKAGFTPTTSQRTWSVAKSIAASVIGRAVEAGVLDKADLRANSPAGVPEWHLKLDPRRRISLHHLLHMESGLDSNRAGNRTDRLYMGGGLVTDTATERAVEVDPGSRWKYANNDTLLAVRALAGRFDTQEAFLAFPFRELLYKIGMTHTKLETDWAGDFILSSQVWTTARDLARLGVLHLQDGMWNGERLLPEDWATYVRTETPSKPARAGQPGYGAQWWVYGETVPELPADTFAARGNRGQILVVIPSRSLVIVRRGYDPAGRQGFQLVPFVADVLAALDAH